MRGRGYILQLLFIRIRKVEWLVDNENLRYMGNYSYLCLYFNSVKRLGYD